MSRYEFEAMYQAKSGVIESDIGFTPNEDGTFTIRAVQKYSRKKNRVIEMKFTRNGLAAIAGTLAFWADAERGKP